jgi:isopenicillin N synthase-like dioxygenase
MPSLPLIDFSAFYGDAQQKKACADQIWRAFSEYGFLYLQNCPISSDQVKCAFKNSAAFFALPEDEKMALTWKSPESNRGYVCQGREKGASQWLTRHRSDHL